MLLLPAVPVGAYDAGLRSVRGRELEVPASYWGRVVLRILP